MRMPLKYLKPPHLYSGNVQCLALEVQTFKKKINNNRSLVRSRNVRKKPRLGSARLSKFDKLGMASPS